MREARGSRAVIALVVALVAAVLVLVLVSERPSAAAPPAGGSDVQKRACFGTYENVQVLMRRSRLREARQAASTCLGDRCPGALRGDCGQWLRDIELRMPTVVVECRTSDGKAITDARLLLDGAPFKDHPDGVATEIDPGDHVVRVERSGSPPVDVAIVVAEGKKAQRIVVEVPPDPAPSSAPAPVPAAVPPPPETAREREATRSTPLTAWVLAGLGGVALGGFGFFAITGKDEERGLDRCSPRCSDDAVGDVRARYITADVLLGVSVVALAAAAYLFLRRADPAPR